MALINKQNKIRYFLIFFITKLPTSVPMNSGFVMIGGKEFPNYNKLVDKIKELIDNGQEVAITNILELTEEDSNNWETDYVYIT